MKHSWKAIALLALGWYLMVPQATKDSPLDEGLPLSSWRIYGSFDTAAACQKNLDFAYHDAKAAKLVSLQNMYLAAACIASDDPRLVAK